MKVYYKPMYSGDNPQFFPTYTVSHSSFRQPIQKITPSNRCPPTNTRDASVANTVGRPRVQKWGLHRRHRAVRIRIVIAIRPERGVEEPNHWASQIQSAQNPRIPPSSTFTIHRLFYSNLS